MTNPPRNEPLPEPGATGDGSADLALPDDDPRFRAEPPRTSSKLVLLVVAGFLAAMVLVGAGVTVAKGWIRDHNAQRELKRKDKEQQAQAEQRRATRSFAPAASAVDPAAPEAAPASALPARFGASAPAPAGAIPLLGSSSAPVQPGSSPRPAAPASRAASQPPVSVMMLGAEPTAPPAQAPATTQQTRDDPVAAYKARMDALQASAAGRAAPPPAAASGTGASHFIPRGIGRGTVQDYARVNATRTVITATPQAQAARLGDRSLLLARGATIPCILQTQLYSNVPGASHCVVPDDVYSDDGKTVLIDKGSTFAGSYQSGLRNGDSRIAVVWHRLKTTDGVVVDVDAGSADGVGTMGLAGEVDNHWGQRIGAALLLSLIDDVVSIEVARQSNGATSTGRATSTADTTRSMSEQVLSSTINIAPTITRNGGSRLSILVQRDLWFDSVYTITRRQGSP
jgi:type IV secretion system protein VirB10